MHLTGRLGGLEIDNQFVFGRRFASGFEQGSDETLIHQAQIWSSSWQVMDLKGLPDLKEPPFLRGAALFLLPAVGSLSRQQAGLGNAFKGLGPSVVGLAPSDRPMSEHGLPIPLRESFVASSKHRLLVDRWMPVFAHGRLCSSQWAETLRGSGEGIGLFGRGPDNYGSWLEVREGAALIIQNGA